MKIHDVKQGSSEWLALRAGRPTASELDNIISPTWKPRDGLTPESYLYRKLAERCMGVPLETFPSFGSMEQGQVLEIEAIPFAMVSLDIQIDRVGFITTDDGRIGCSPDGLIGDDGGIEVKCPRPDTHLKYLLAGVVPKDYLAQVHGSMYVTGRPWWLFLSYSRQFPALVVKVTRDEKIISAIGSALDSFLATFDAKYAEIVALKAVENERKNAEFYADASNQKP